MLNLPGHRADVRTVCGVWYLSNKRTIFFMIFCSFPSLSGCLLSWRRFYCHWISNWGQNLEYRCMGGRSSEDEYLRLGKLLPFHLKRHFNLGSKSNVFALWSPVTPSMLPTYLVENIFWWGGFLHWLLCCLGADKGRSCLFKVGKEIHTSLPPPPFRWWDAGLCLFCLSTVVCCQPTELIWVFFCFINFPIILPRRSPLRKAGLRFTILPRATVCIAMRPIRVLCVVLPFERTAR